MLDATIELVGEQGFAYTTVADVIARATASRRTFYEHFSNMQACFLASADDIAARWLRDANAAVDRASADGEDATQALIGALFESALGSPGALRILTGDLAAAGRRGIDLRERVLTDLGQTLSRAMAADAKRAGEPPAKMTSIQQSILPRTLAGAILRIPYVRALRGGQMRRPPRGQLLALIPDLAGWVASYRSAPVPEISQPSEPLAAGGRAPGTLSLGFRAAGRRRLPRGESSVSHSLVVHSQRERLLDAVANLSAAKGYDTVTIPEIVQEAGVSVEAFYEHFSGREDTLLVAYELGRRKAVAIVQHAYRAEDDWQTAVRAGVTALLVFLASEPSFAQLALIDVPAASGKLATAIHEGAVAALLEAGADRLPPGGNGYPQIAVEASTCAVRELCVAYAAQRRATELASAVDVATHLALAPFTASGPSAR